ncbi:hypothetical protein H2200_010846 [Cladophialophora chaetospira]|uniref:Choline monooxygenase, chloroplastic n=1 Tax=Cladophialophora chaetospira TaxID=386627 RepID=A0AA39CE07_9EURO|nr:hypothetical protein H2200_010846 [Cladophialophora chaetospira]
MAPALLNYLGFGSQTQTSVAKESDKNPIRALPSSWYTSQDLYNLETRAIFSKKWMLITHQNRLPNPGDWIKFDIAGYEFVVSRDRASKFHAFHNVCRHRAFPVFEGEKGTSKIFACRYHGWSYGLDGKLAKAPKYDDLEGFDKSANGLFPIHVHLDTNGFVWVNLDSGEKPEIAWEDDFAGIDTQERYKQYNFDDYVFDHDYKMTGAYNWKILADNFNECYHCPTTHPDVPTLADIQTHEVDTDAAWIKHRSVLTKEQEQNGLGISSTYYFPNASLSILPSSSSMHYQIFRNKTSSEEDFQLIAQMYARIVSEDKVLCELAQKNLNARIFINGELHPRLEKGPLYFQAVAREVVRSHYEREKVAKREIWPARRALPNGAGAVVSREDEELCEGLACRTDEKGLVW